VIATASSDQKLDLARALDAHVLVDYTEKDWPEKVREVTRGKDTDVILEMVGSDFLEKFLTGLNVFGTMVVFGAASRQRGAIVPAILIAGCHTVVGF